MVDIDASRRGDFRVHLADARDTSGFLTEFAERNGLHNEFLTLTVTSPPYADLVDYGSEDQIGWGQSYDEYLTDCASVFASVYEHTKDDGALWLVADTYLAPGRRGQVSALRALPFDLAAAAAKAGWTLRDVVIWRKDKTRPWSHRGRLRHAFEYVLFLVKSNTYKYHVDRLRDNRNLGKWWVRYPERHNPWGASPDNVWDIPIPVQGSWANSDMRHACPFPPELVERMLAISSDEGDIVFDPFSGSGMVASVAEAMGRNPLGLELNQEFITAYEEIVRPEVLAARPTLSNTSSEFMTKSLLELRALKYARELCMQLMKAGKSLTSISGVVLIAEEFATSTTRSNYGRITCTLVIGPLHAGESEGLLETALELSRRRPLSKFGLEVLITATEATHAVDVIPEAALYIYADGKTWASAGQTTEPDFAAETRRFPNIYSNIAVDFTPE